MKSNKPKISSSRTQHFRAWHVPWSSFIKAKYLLDISGIYIPVFPEFQLYELTCKWIQTVLSKREKMLWLRLSDVESQLIKNANVTLLLPLPPPSCPCPAFVQQCLPTPSFFHQNLQRKLKGLLEKDNWLSSGSKVSLIFPIEFNTTQVIQKQDNFIFVCLKLYYLTFLDNPYPLVFFLLAISQLQICQLNYKFETVCYAIHMNSKRQLHLP